MKQVLTTLALSLLFTTGFTQLNNLYPKTISVSGSADMEIVPDEIYAVITLKEYEKRGTGKIDLEKIKTEFLNNCKNIGLPDSSVTIASYGGTNYEWWRKKKNKDELMASIAYQVKFSTSKKMDELVEKLDDDATQSFQVTRVSHSKIKEYRKELKILAIKAAKEKGGYLASAINEGLGEAVTIIEPEEYLTPEYRENNISQLSNTAFLQDAENSSVMGTNFKMIKLRYEVKVVFALK
jgi:uncharacterized protein